MKKYWHTKTLFIEWWKYKWARKYDYCIYCKNVEKPHKWRWLCTKCWDKERDNNPNRRKVKKKSSEKWHKNNYQYIPIEEQKKKWTKKQRTKTKAQYQHEWYTKWREPILLLRKWIILKRKWYILPEYKLHAVPFDIWPKIKDEPYELYKERIRKFELIKNYINKWNKN